MEETAIARLWHSKCNDIIKQGAIATQWLVNYDYDAVFSVQLALFSV
jgi:hypothetical protein